MIYFFRILSPDHPKFICEIQVDGDTTLFTFHKAIQSACKIEEEFCSFFTCDAEWNKLIEYTAIDMGMEGMDLTSMENITLNELLIEKKQKLVYSYDIIENRNLYIEVSENWPERKLDMPVLCFIEGDITATPIKEEAPTYFEEEDYLDDQGWDDDFNSGFESIDDLDI